MTNQKNISALQPVSGQTLKIGDGFSGLGFRHTQFSGTMDPIIMVDHYTMTTPTFGAHPHAGISAVSVLFEDTVGKFNNRDSLGNDFDIQAGDLYWMNAGSGAIHDEKPREGAKVHGLQMFINLPARLKNESPSSLYVKREDMATLEGEGYRVRVVIGQSNQVATKTSSVWPFTILDGYTDESSSFEHIIPHNFNAWVYAVERAIEYKLEDKWLRLDQGQSITISETDKATLRVRGTSAELSHFALLSGETINESFVQQGPFAMTTQEENNEVAERYHAGELGSLSE
ncbi:pirin [Pseudoalteromonas sp. NBT06-2]|uniref:pirin family protein n=1 Tax=Pseudoalteromonas sp. NBT06-2 TaxID=2025950 RepID=UPI000BA5805C|nr:pirin family protein [Pseudoalteromonas sp. NBT06-2]PAJ71903.1 pirin [Pseudoalteromonas sp. NBT06-2]